MAAEIQVVFDCADPASQTEFWATALGYIVQPPPDGFASWEDFARKAGIPEDLWDSRSAIVDPDGEGPRIFFQKVPEPKTTKNRVHLDVNAAGPRSDPEQARRMRVTAKVEELIDVGATVLRENDENGEHWIVMQDPEGNEFCVQ